MSQIKLSKKTYLSQHAEKILQLKKSNYSHQQIIDYLKTHEHMPFELDVSLFSRHCKSIFAQANVNQINQKLMAALEKDRQYIQQLEQSNRNLIKLLNEKNKEIHQLIQSSTDQQNIIEELHNEKDRLNKQPIPEETEQQLRKLFDHKIKSNQTIQELQIELTEQKKAHQADRKELLKNGQAIINRQREEIADLKNQLVNKKKWWFSR